jgi:hypothetical protein
MESGLLRQWIWYVVFRKQGIDQGGEVGKDEFAKLLGIAIILTNGKTARAYAGFEIGELTPAFGACLSVVSLTFYGQGIDVGGVP